MIALCRQSWRWVAIAGVLLLVTGFVAATNRPTVRYFEYFYQCSMILGTDPATGPVDLAVIGSSRSMRAMQADLLASHVEEARGFRPVIFDLSRSYRDMGHMIPFVEDLLANIDVDMLLVEFKETGDQWRHPQYELATTFGQIAESFRSRPSVPVLGRVQEQVRLILDRLTNRATKLFRGGMSRNCVRRGPQPAATTDPSPPWFVASEILVNQTEARGATWTDEPAPSVDLDAPEEERNVFYVRRMVEVAEAAGTRIFFYYIPPLYGLPLSDDFAAQFEDHFHAPLLQLSVADVEQVNPAGYTDATHMGWEASDLLMTRLSELLPWRR